MTNNLRDSIESEVRGEVKKLRVSSTFDTGGVMEEEADYALSNEFLVSYKEHHSGV